MSLLQDARAADRGELAGLQGAQEAGLHGQGHLGHLVQEEGAAVGALEDALVVGHRAGEGAAGVAEELALEHALADGAAVEADEGPVPARGELSWMARATSSLPVPLSPRISTFTSSGAAWATSDEHLGHGPAAADDAAALAHPAQRSRRSTTWWISSGSASAGRSRTADRRQVGSRRPTPPPRPPAPGRRRPRREELAHHVAVAAG